MEEIIKKAHELGELLAKSEELLQYQEMELAFGTDEEAQAAVSDYEKKSMALSEEMRSSAMTPESLETFRNRMNELMTELTKNKTARAYLEAKSGFNRLIGQVNEILAFHIRGEEAGGSCSGNCGSCGGCH
ncbi:MAG: YlbF family regulator [Ruminococcaceae bacterium]|nr:YlbF family regulator [Oscillospiraceae bacterium]